MASIKISSLVTGVPQGTDLTPATDTTDDAQASTGTTKKYIRSDELNFYLQAQGLTTYQAVLVATTEDLTATYNNGTLGVGATLTNATTNIALTIDDVDLAVGNRVLVKDQITQYQNGIYVVTTVGSASVPWVLTRALDYNQSADVVQYGVILVNQGTANAGLLFQEVGPGPFTMGSTAITFAAFTSQSLTIPVSPSQGGTGVNNGNNTLTLAGDLATVGAFNSTFTMTADTNVTFPTSGTLATTAGASGIVNPGLINQLGYYASAGSTISGLTGANQAALTTNGSGLPVWVPMSAGQVLIGTTSGSPAAAAISSGTNITVTNASGSITVNVSGVISPTLGGTGVNNGANTLTLAGNLATSGSFASTFTMTGATNVTFPTSGTLATTAGSVSSVSGTTNRITSTGGTTPVIDISAAYVGQSSITTLGTIGTGVWQGTLIGGAYGGTGVNNGVNTATFAGNLNFASSFTTSGSFAVTQTYTGATNVTFPTSGTLATTSGTVSSVSGTSNRITSTGGTTPVIDIAATYVGQSSIATLGTITTGVWNGTTVAVANGGTGVTSVTTAPTATSFAGWDANKNLSANSFIEGFTTTATAGGTTVLTVSSTQIQEFTGTLTQTITLPVTSTLVQGMYFDIINNSSGVLTINSSGGNLVLSMAANTSATIVCVLNSGTTAASWNSSYFFDNGAGVLSITGTANQVIASASTGAVTLSLPQSIATSSSPTFVNVTGSTSLTTPLIKDVNGNNILALNPNPGAVNNWSLNNTTTGNALALLATGTDTNIGLQIIAKGAGTISFYSAATSSQYLFLSGTGLQHASNFNFPSTAASQTYTFPDATGTVLLTGTAINSVPSITFSSTSGIIGTTTNDSAAAGSVGEFISSVVAYPGASVTSGVAKNVTSISLTAGDWDVWGNILFAVANTTVVNQGIGWISTTSAALPSLEQVGWFQYGTGGMTSNSVSVAVTAPQQRISIASTTTIYLSTQANFTISTITASGFIYARRRR